MKPSLLVPSIPIAPGPDRSGNDAKPRPIGRSPAQSGPLGPIEYVLTLLLMCGWDFRPILCRSSRWGEGFPVFLGHSPARPTQRRHSYQLQTAINSAGALRHASLVCSSRLLISSVPLTSASLIIGRPCPTRAAATSHREAPPAIDGLSRQRRASRSCPHRISSSRMRISSAHLVCSYFMNIIIYNIITLIITRSYYASNLFV